MTRTLRRAIGPALVFTVAACASQAASAPGPAAAPSGGGAAAAAPAAAESSAPVSIYTGVYTAAQADRGNKTQQRECSGCHNPNDWAAGRVLSGFEGQTAFDLVSHIRSIMPMDAPGRLSMQQYTDIVAFIFELNDVPAGDTELQPEQAALEKYLVEYRK